MNTPTKVGAFALGLAAAFGGAAAVGAAVGPVASAESPVGHDSERESYAGREASTDHGSDHAAQPQVTDDPQTPGGLMIAQHGYALDLTQAEVAPSKHAQVGFRILGPDGAPVTDYTESHGKDLHLIAVRRDMTGFQHVHPDLAPDGTWSVPLDLSRAGEHRVFADFTPAGGDRPLTLGADLSVAGRYDPQRLPAASTTARVDGYTVAVDGALVPGEESKLTLSVGRDGEPVTDLQPYLQAYGHLVVLRDGDLAYLHVHPAGSPGDGTTQPGPEVTFYATAPSAGKYRLFLDFRHDGVVRTAEFTAVATGPTGSTPTPGSNHPDDSRGSTDSGHGH